MDYKEKYEKALEWMKSIYPTMQGSDKEDAEHYFPELALSEDEKMIIGLQGFLSAYGSDYFGTDGWQKFDDWLEKQKEQKPAENGGKELLYVSNKSYNIGFRDGKREAEQKPAELCEEDEAHRDFILELLEDQIRFFKKDAEGEHCVKQIRIAQRWLKSLRPSWKPSEEHLSALLAIISDPNNIGSQTCQLALTDLYAQLKKL